MKIRNMVGLLCALVIILVAGCGKDENNNTGRRQTDGGNDVQNVLEQGMAGSLDSKETNVEIKIDNTDEPEVTQETATPGIEITETAEKQDNAKAQDAENERSVSGDEAVYERVTDGAESTGECDVDLTVLSSTMVYSEVYNMMYYPENYIGKTVKMKGLYAVYHDENTDKFYHACIIQDATACCEQGIEFETTDEYKYPEDYPGQGEEVCVTGIFDTYQEGEYTYCTLRNARIS
ncbi:MAG: hypothetical protein IJT37_06715 [Lachnospiraceae bacterium]|nr:hypothetical protein [Lachnospiraceae bacterium]